MTTEQKSTAVLDQFGFPARWSVHTRREIRRVDRALAAMPPEVRARLEEGRRAADALVLKQDAGGSSSGGLARRVVLVLPFPITTGGMRVQVELGRMLAASGAEVHVRQVRGVDCTDAKYDACGFASREPVGDPRRLPKVLRELAPATLLMGCWIDYFAGVESGAGPVIGYSAGEPTLKETAGFDAAFVEFAHRMHQLPVTLWSGSHFIEGIFRQRFGRESQFISVPIAGEMFGRDFTAPARPPFRVILIGPEHHSTKGVPGALAALDPLRHNGVEVVWVSPEPPTAERAALADEVHVGLNAEGVAAAIGSCHALVFPSRLEGLGNPPLEAMALGVPSVLCPNGGSQEYAVPGENCLQVPYGDAEALRAAVSRLRDEPELVSRIVGQGRETAERYRPATIHRAVTAFLATRFDDLPFVPLG
ncbi:glycosyltransferase involved in cell wall biosynthesis [Crossiella equi]|uniref:Glycosyltransferase involved in cell wall biosynthesis n=1 Tax=Crossiella equi TaxID=130796 RepID=A0ABS5A5R2_9PSEU|nr:glycosyltransferase family 4 protein [Crossiella equi]MBP2471929.1 glycosyltransferase involved in cell wall biosynthesis [Crossiella equi]